MIDKYITEENGSVLFSTLPVSCKNCISSAEDGSQTIESCDSFKEKRRIAKIQNCKALTFACTNEYDLIKSSRIFKEKLAIYDELRDEINLMKKQIQEEYNQPIKRLIHNLTSINAHSIQDLYSLIPQETLTQNYLNQIKNIERLILAQPDEAAKTFLRIAKNNASMKTEFSVFKKLYETDPILQPRYHPVRKVIFNLLYIFFPDFTDQYIYVNVQENYDKLYIDYESMHVAFYHLIENATKYAKPGSTIDISFSNKEKEFSIDFRMLSLKIEEDEKLKILEENYSGSQAKKEGKSGNGIGLHLVNKILEMNRAQLIVLNNVDKSSKFLGGVPYEWNIFRIIFRIDGSDKSAS
ncbi:sensor histidine kinase [Chitinophaga agri]|uniref:histidine kinase n=1 Tax=Chitinophaga agri TaxID=2703787 RepID=A0A6B9ZH35_9BACT|nr:ATP-binding protein [Chitinophaga agri]QHS59913.1 HAMP domain-containing histidine kinase [Chitinophaga agri]